MSVDALEREIRAAVDDPPGDADARAVVERLLLALEAGTARAAEPDGDGGWRVHRWVKQGILLGFRVGKNLPVGDGRTLPFRDRDTFPLWDPNRTERDVRIVPGGSAVRRGAFVGDGVVLMPPSYVNVGAYVGAGSMIDSHALVGSCAQVGANVHVSAAAQIGGVLEPIGALPVVVEDEAFLGGGCGVYEGTRIGRGAVLGAGVILTRRTPVYDLVEGTIRRAGGDGEPLVIPDRAVVVPGSRPARGAFAEREGIHLHAPVIAKYRDARTDAAAALEEALR